MTYILVTIFLATGQVYIEQRNLSLPACAGRLAMLRTTTSEVVEKLEPRIGKVRYLCLPSRVTVTGAE